MAGDMKSRKSPTEAPVSKAQYARLIGVTPQYIGKLVRQGKIPVRDDGLIDPSEADTYRLAFRDPARKHLVQSKVAAIEHAENAAETSAYHKARTARMAYAAKLSQLEFERARGALIDKQETLATVYAICRQARDRLLQLTARLPALVTGKRTKDEVREIIDREVRLALESLAEEHLEGILD